jgi:hypothetical protein
MLEVELNESLRRKQNDLRQRIETLSVSRSGGGVETAHQDLDKKKRELRVLANSIETATKRNRGQLNIPFHLPSWLT